MFNSFRLSVAIISLMVLNTHCMKILFDGEIWQKGEKRFKICQELKKPDSFIETKFLDYSLKFNAYVAVCTDFKTTTIRIEKIDPDQTTELMANHVLLMSTAISTDSYSLDRLNGLLYYADYHHIYVVDLRKPTLAQFNILTRQLGGLKPTIILSIIVRPHVAKLMWLEKYVNNRRCLVKQALQNAKQVETLFTTDDVRFREIIYDEQEDLYILIKQTADFETLVRVIDGKNVNDSGRRLDFKIGKNGFDIRCVKFHRRSLIFSEVSDPEPDEIFRFYSINIGKHIDSLRSESEKLSTTVFDSEKWETVTGLDQPNSTEVRVPGNVWDFVKGRFIIFDPDSRIDSIKHDKVICESQMCLRSEKDFCIPVNQTHSQCTSGEIIAIKRGTTDRLFIILTLGVLVSLILLILLIYFLFFSKQKTRFYTIRLKRLNRVESSKLQVKPPAAEEIAE